MGTPESMVRSRRVSPLPLAAHTSRPPGIRRRGATEGARDRPPGQSALLIRRGLHAEHRNSHGKRDLLPRGWRGEGCRGANTRCGAWIPAGARLVRRDGVRSAHCAEPRARRIAARGRFVGSAFAVASLPLGHSPCRRIDAVQNRRVLRRKRVSRSPGTIASARMFAAHEEAATRGVPVAEVLGEREQAAREHNASAISRRELLAAATGLATTAAIGTSPALSLAASLTGKPAPRVAIVGAGLAGIRCAHMLWNGEPGHPIASTIFEANPERVGGRCWTLRNYFAAGLITEHGGQFINSNQHAVRRLAHALGLALEDVNGGNLPSGEEAYLIDGATYTNKEALADWDSVGYRTFHRRPAGSRNSCRCEVAGSPFGDGVAGADGDRHGEPIRQADARVQRGRAGRRPRRTVGAAADRRVRRKELAPSSHNRGRQRTLPRRRRQRPAGHADAGRAAAGNGSARAPAGGAAGHLGRCLQARPRRRGNHPRNDGGHRRARAAVHDAQRSRPFEVVPVGHQAPRDRDVRYGHECEDPCRTRP